MKDSHPFYSHLLIANEEAFAQQLFTVAYHALTGAMHCAYHLQDPVKLAEVEERAYKQFQQLYAPFFHQPLSTPPLEVTLYHSLVETLHRQGTFPQTKVFAQS